MRSTRRGCSPPTRNQPVQPYLDDDGRSDALDLELTVEINGTVVSSPPFASMYWTPAQMLAHMTVNGASLRTGDLYASGTVSGPRADQYGSLMELSWNGERPVTTANGPRDFLADGDVVVISRDGSVVGGRITLAPKSGGSSPLTASEVTPDARPTVGPAPRVLAVVGRPGRLRRVRAAGTCRP